MCDIVNSNNFNNGGGRRYTIYNIWVIHRTNSNNIWVLYNGGNSPNNK